LADFGKLMKHERLAPCQKDGWRNIAITLLDPVPGEQTRKLVQTPDFVNYEFAASVIRNRERLLCVTGHACVRERAENMPKQ